MEDMTDQIIAEIRYPDFEQFTLTTLYRSDSSDEEVEERIACWHSRLQELNVAYEMTVFVH